MNSQKIAAKITALVLLTLITGFFSLSARYQTQIFPSAPEWITKQKVHLGLDLQGGTQLDYKIDLRKVAVKDQDQIIEGVTEVINRRVNSLGVSEPNIYTSSIGDESHIIVELAGIKDIEEAKQKVGKTIQLEFKEEKTGPPDPTEKVKIETQAKAVLEKTLATPQKFIEISQEEAKANPGKIFDQIADEAYFQDDKKSLFKLPQELFKLQKDSVYSSLVEITENDPELIFTGIPGYAIYKVLENQTVDRKIDYPKEVSVGHLLIAYKGAEKAPESVTRTEEEAKKLAEDLKKRLDNGENFATLAKENSNDEGTKDNGGLLDKPVIASEGTYVKEFSDAAIALGKTGDLSPITKTAYGFHIIKAEKIKEASSETRKEPQIKIARLFFSTAPYPWQDTNLNGEHFLHADVDFNDAYLPYVSIRFDAEGGQLFQELTKKNVGKRLAIFVGGELISAPTVQQEISGGSATITGDFSVKEAKELARDLNTGAIPAPIILSGQLNIGASLGADAFEKTLKASLLGLLLLALFMIAYYRFAGFVANLALIAYGILMIFLIKIALPYSVSIIISLVVFTIITGKILKNQDSGWEKFVSFLLACFILFFLSFLLSTPLVLTLAGIAGIILSVGMAVDANVLIFERIKEELRIGRPINAAIELGFERAWSSIRDSNFSTLITCAILLSFGSSVIKGFAFNLSTGILVSMFSALTITRTLLETSVGHKLLQNHNFFIGLSSKSSARRLNIIGRRHFWFAFSGVILAISIFSAPLLGLKLGMDFTGGSLLEIKFTQEISAAQINDVINETQNQLSQKTTSFLPYALAQNVQPSNVQPASIQPTENSADLKKPPIDLGKAVINSSGPNTFIIKIKDISEENHALLLQKLKEKFGALEEIRFTTIGPTVGSTLKKKALQALGIAIIMIVLYIAFAFRNVPKHINPWRFGACAIVALIHDVIIPFGAFVILGSFLGVELDILFITALLALIGYSINDTIVVFDRIRENLKHQKAGETFAEIANKSVNETLARSINTSLTTVLAILPLAFFGAESIKYFIIVLIIGIISGTYSSIFIASTMMVELHKRSRK